LLEISAFLAPEARINSVKFVVDLLRLTVVDQRFLDFVTSAVAECSATNKGEWQHSTAAGQRS